MYIQVKKAEYVPWGFGGQDIKITMIGLYEDNGKRVRRIKLTSPELLEMLKKNKMFLPMKVDNALFPMS